MISYAAYKLIHLVGIILLFFALGALMLHGINRGSREGNRARRLVAVTHGLGVFLVLLGGFGLLARIGVEHGMSWPGWVWTKFGVWLLLGAAILIPYRRPGLARPLWFALPLLGVLAAYMAIHKPF